MLVPLIVPGDRASEPTRPDRFHRLGSSTCAATTRCSSVLGRAGRRPAARSRGRCRPGGDGAARTSPGPAATPSTSPSRPAGWARRSGCWRGWAPARWRPTCAGTPSSPASTPAGFVEADEPVSLAVVGLGPDGSADYGFHVLGAADWQWTDDELAAVLPDGHRDPARRARSPAGPRRAREAIARLVERLSGDGGADQRRPQHPADAGRGAGRRDARQHRGRRPRAAGPAGRPGRRRQGERRGPRVAGAGRAAPTTWTPPRGAGPTAGPRWSLLTDGGAPLRVARPGHVRCCTGEPPRVTVADTVGAGDSLAAGLLAGLLDGGGHRPGRARGAARRGAARAGGRRRAGRRPQLHAGRRRPAHPGGAGRRPRRPGDATGRRRRRRLRRTVGDRAPRAAARRATTGSGDTDTRAPAPPDVVPPVRRLRRARPERRRRGRRLRARRRHRRPAGRTCTCSPCATTGAARGWAAGCAGGSTSWPRSTGARVVQAVTRPGRRRRAGASTPRSGRAPTSPATTPGRATDRVVLTRSLLRLDRSGSAAASRAACRCRVVERPGCRTTPSSQRPASSAPSSSIRSAAASRAVSSAHALGADGEQRRRGSPARSRPAGGAPGGRPSSSDSAASAWSARQRRGQRGQPVELGASSAAATSSLVRKWL